VVVTGDELDNVLAGGAGADELYGLGGDDTLNGGAGDDSLFGGPGNDDFERLALFETAPGSNLLDGGAGDDTFHVHSNGFFIGVTDVATGGSGRDSYAIESAFAERSYVVTDFAAGEGGDLIDLYQIFQFDLAGNPFREDLGYLRLAESDGDTLLQVDFDGVQNGAAWKSVLRLSNVLPQALTVHNFVQGMPPDGSEAPLLLLGSAGGDSLVGSVFGDEIRGEGGADRLEGRWGGDLLVGGDGADQLGGEWGNDTLLGGAGADRLDGGKGSDLMKGGGGDDVFVDVSGGGGKDRLRGGDGNDRMFVTYGDGLVEGGEGDDAIFFAIFYDGQATVTGGAGRDRIDPGNAEAGIVVTDFEAGEGGDLFTLSGLIFFSSGEFGSNPFAEGPGFFRLVQSGADALLEWDRDGAAGSAYGWSTKAVLLDVDAGSLSSGNFGGELIVGTGFDDRLEGTFGSDTLRGLGGEDTLIGVIGEDLMEGGADDDLYYVNSAGDVVLEAFAEGTDGVRATISYTLGEEVELLKLTGARGIDGSGNELANRLTGNAAANALAGGEGDDTLVGSLGADSMLGGGGNDLYLVDDAGDLVVETSNGPLARDALAAGLEGFIDTVRAAIDYSLGNVANVENVSLAGQARQAIGNSLDNVLRGNALDNLLDGLAGDDTLKGLGGNDVLLWRGDDSSVSGNAGIDTLRIAGSGRALDLTTLAEGTLAGIERIDLRGAANSALTLNAAEVLALSDNDVLRVLGDAGDSVSRVGREWNYRSTAGGFHKFTLGGAAVFIDTDLVQDLAPVA